MMRKLRPVYPYFVMVYPLLAMVSKYHAELYWKEVVFAIAAGLAVIGAGEVVLWPILRNAHARGCALGLGAVFFWCAMPLLDWAREGQSERGGVEVGLVGVTLVIGLGLVVVLRRTRRELGGVTVLGNVLAMCIAGVVLLQTGYSVATSGHVEAPVVEVGEVVAPEDAPDIIHIVADMYGRQDMIERYFDYDNTPFIEALRARGFYVADNAWANYNFTRSAVPSVLNYQYLAGIAPVHGGNVEYSTLIRENRLAAYLRARGYEFTSFATGTEISEIRNADHYLAPPSAISEFGNLLITRTPARFVYNRVRMRKEETLDARYMQYDEHRARILYTFDGLKHFERGTKPQFVFAHVLMPHDPFVLDANLNPVYPETRYVLAAYPKWENPNPVEYYEGYRGQVQAFNKLALEAIDSILERYPETVIVLHGDHGPRSNKLEEYHGKGWEMYVHEEMGILNALYLPGVDTSEVLYPSISPVNSFRVVLNEYFDEELPLLEDRSYFVEWWENRVHDVTERLAEPVESTP